MTNFRCYFYDIDAADATAAIWRQGYAFSADVPSNTQVTSVSSTGTGGYQQVVSSLNETIKYRDGDLRNVYTVLVTMPSTTSVRFRGCRIFWNRQVSAAPAVASFGDVPTTSPIFRFVEALVASGVTAGCAGGNYCPEAPLTRGQMAVFLSAALGLHWPW